MKTANLATVNMSGANVHEYSKALDRSFCIEYGKEQNDPSVSIGGNLAMYTMIMNAIKMRNKPCECKITDGSDFAYLQSNEYSKREDGSDSRIKDPEYFQGSEMPNFNLSFYYDKKTNKKQVWINFDLKCPPGFHRFIAGESKIFARYNSEIVAGKLVVTSGNTPANGKSLIHHVQAHNATNANLQEVTFWEQTCLIWLSIAEIQTRNIEAAYPGMTSGSFYGQYTNGLAGCGQFGQTTVEITKADGTKVTTNPYRVWHLENPFHGDSCIEMAGAITKIVGNDRLLYITRDADLANTLSVVQTNDVSSFETSCPVLRNTTDTWMLDCVGYWPVGSKTGGSSTTGLCDYNWGINTQGDNCIPHVGANSADGSSCGFFALRLNTGATDASSYLRGRAAMKR